MKMVQSASPGGPRALDQARRPRVTKPPDQRRRDILDAATRLFRERGFDPTTVQAVAAEADVAAGTVYLYFPSKDAILTAVHEEFDAGMLERFAAVAEEVIAEEVASGTTVSYQDVVERLIDGMVAYSLERRDVTQVLARHLGRTAESHTAPAFSAGLAEVLTRVIREAIRLGYVHTSDPEMTAYLLNIAAETAIGHAIAFEDEATLARVVRQVKELYIKALAPAGH